MQSRIELPITIISQTNTNSSSNQPFSQISTTSSSSQASTEIIPAAPEINPIATSSESVVLDVIPTPSTKEEKIRTMTAIINGFSIQTLFTTLMNNNWHAIFIQFGKFFLLPALAAADIVEAIFAWRDAHLNRTLDGKMKKIGVLDAAVSSGSAVALSTAVIGTLAVGLAFFMAGPIIIFSTVGGVGLFKGGLAAYYFYKLLRAKDPEKKKKYIQKLTDNGIASISSLLVAAGVASGMILTKGTLGAVLGMTGAGFVVGTGFVKGYKLYKEHKKQAIAFEQGLALEMRGPVSRVSVENINRVELTINGKEMNNSKLHKFFAGLKRKLKKKKAAIECVSENAATPEIAIDMPMNSDHLTHTHHELTANERNSERETNNLITLGLFSQTRVVIQNGQYSVQYTYKATQHYCANESQFQFRARA